VKAQPELGSEKCLPDGLISPPLSRITSGSHPAWSRAPELEAAEQRLREAMADLRRVAQSVYPVLLKEARLRPALDALGEERPLTVQAAPRRRYPAAIEFSVYLVVARMSAARRTSVVINDDGSHLTHA
jgi:signal transduction histidine kinase